MLRVSSILQLQTIWESLPSQSISSNVSVKDIIDTTIVNSLEETSSPQSSSSIKSSLSSSSSSSLPASPSVHSCDASTSHPLVVPEPVNSAALLLSVPEIDQEKQKESSSLPSSSTKVDPRQNNKQSKSTPTDIPPLPTKKITPPPVPAKDDKKYLMKINNKIGDMNKVHDAKENPRFLASRTVHTPPASIHSFAIAPTNQLISGANKALRRESSKLNLRRKSLSKKLKKAVSNIKLNANESSNTIIH
ncbi:uncharacterized protein BX664DRAFT_327329 [Halteromyces radiatus]|uniref:uncharacterized protein n=1 Tax=Halteromyces radiatus TaxID=101107 RepID=UPI00221F7C2E|nr:uncharacterized protein BX664DRAFT_327329 [Halteromyces radiatus]KAI8092463.1 hypothetical protein BX664DRAFT_327329 [Halteromyces radiatus]